MENQNNVSGSFRDPSGFVFSESGVIYRQINHVYQENYDLLMESGLYDALVKTGLLIPHEEVGLEVARSQEAYRIIQPEAVPFISYPYEWAFSQLKDAALVTLRIQKIALEHGMSLKDASAYNIQFVDNRPVFIDTLSFERYEEGGAWVPYRQFCQHFLAPLALMAYRDVRLGQLLQIHIDGIPLDMASKLLPVQSRLKLGLMLHIHLHARSQRTYADREDVTVKTRTMSRQSLLGLIDNLESAVKGLRWRTPQNTAWAGYYEGDSYSAEAFDAKKALVDAFIAEAAPRVVWDLGANTGVFSRIASQQGIMTVAWDVDPGAVERNYRQAVKEKATNLLPLVLDLTNPSPAIGWANAERLNLTHRANADLVMALALIHHLAIANNVPLAEVAAYLASLAPWLVIEFVPKTDKKVRKLLATREDIFPNYTVPGFEAAFRSAYELVRKEAIPGSDRVLYLMQRKR